ncbi:MAG: DUF2867 domain-containing protein [Rikenellaceae bacterium]|nr:DUF2867 domain-containing protein [Rikenellaceae bacterium]
MYHLPGKKDFTADDIQSSFWYEIPGWVQWLMKIRKILVKPLGLRGQFLTSPEAFSRGIRSGSGDGIMSVPMKNRQETVVKLSDKHLHSYMSVYIRRKEDSTTVILNSAVQFHNRLGQLYFIAIKPFHKLVVKSMLRRAIRRLVGSGL